MNKITLYIVTALMLFVPLSNSSDFDKVVEVLNRKGCHSFEFINIIESDIFETVDTTSGSLYLSDDNRFKIEIGSDIYIGDSTQLYSYSIENNQVVIEPRSLEDGGEFSFITDIDKIYSYEALKSADSYILRKNKDLENDHPDSMTVIIDPEHNILKQIKYYDVNEELNRIIFLKQDHGINCDQNIFKADFPDTVEKVKL